jgi:hypothetical protein
MNDSNHNKCTEKEYDDVRNAANDNKAEYLKEKI